MTRTQLTRIRRLARAFAVALAALAVAAPAAQAMPAPAPRSVDTLTTPQTTVHTFYLDRYLATHRGLVAGSPATPTPTPVATPVAAPVSTGNGFDWADAAIGAAVAAGTLALLGLAGIGIGVRARGFAH